MPTITEIAKANSDYYNERVTAIAIIIAQKHAQIHAIGSELSNCVASFKSGTPDEDKEHDKKKTEYGLCLDNLNSFLVKRQEEMAYLMRLSLTDICNGNF